MKLCEAEYFELPATGEYIGLDIIRHAFIISCPSLYSEDEAEFNSNFEEWLQDKAYYRHLIPHF